MTHEVKVSPQDIIAMISFEAQRIVAASQLHAAGHPMPSPEIMGSIIEKMAGLNHVLSHYNALLPQEQEPELKSQAKMKVELS